TSRGFRLQSDGELLLLGRSMECRRTLTEEARSRVSGAGGEASSGTHSRPLCRIRRDARGGSKVGCGRDDPEGPPRPPDAEECEGSVRDRAGGSGRKRSSCGRTRGSGCGWVGCLWRCSSAWIPCAGWGIVSHENQDPMLAVVENAKAHERGPICDASDEKFETLDFAGKEGFVLISMDEATSTSPMGAVSEAKCNEVNMEKSAVSDLMEEESREESGRYMAKDPTQKWAE
ncbi:hypothetical protein GW17_00030935, partial [Ensete ventricosum]